MKAKPEARATSQIPQKFVNDRGKINPRLDPKPLQVIMENNDRDVSLNMEPTDDNSSRPAWTTGVRRPALKILSLRDSLREHIWRQRNLRSNMSSTTSNTNNGGNGEEEGMTNPVDYCLSSKGSRVVRASVFIFCTLTCIFQLWYFLGFYFEFPTSVDVEVVRRRFIDFESVTVCTAKAFRKEKLCKLKSAFCIENELANRDEQVLNMISTKMKEYSIGITEFLINCTMFTLYNRNSFTELCQKNSKWVYDGYSTCWTIAPLLDNKSAEEYMFQLDLNFYLDEYNFTSESTAGWVYFHSRYLVPDVERDISVSIPYLQASRGFVEQIVVNYLEAPYPPKCKNITKISNETERVKEELCYHECLWKKLNEFCKCIPGTISFMEPHTACNVKEEEVCQQKVNLGQLRDDCEMNCPVNCRITLYKLSIFRNDYERREDTKKLTVFTLDLRQVYHLEYNHKPQFTPIEVFSYVGGFMGIWLGISIPVAFDRFTFMVAFFHNLRKYRKLS